MRSKATVDGQPRAPPNSLVTIGSTGQWDVDVITPDLAGNATGRALLLADMLASEYRVRIIGAASGPVWLPLKARSDREVVVAGSLGWSAPRTIAGKLAAPVTIAVKPLLTSLGAAVLAKRPRRLVLDIDDPEFALLTTSWRTVAATTLSPLGIIPSIACALLNRRADAITVSGPALQRKFGGVIIPHARDERVFEVPEVRNRVTARDSLRIDRHAPLAVFVGTPRPHKGAKLLGQLAERIAPARLAVVGAESGVDYRPAFTVPKVDYPTALRWIAASDVVIVPQQPGAVARYQVPAKLSDALAVGRAIVASDLEPIRDVVAGAALLTEPSVGALSQGVRAIFNDTALKARLEKVARRRFVERFSFRVVAPTLQTVIDPQRG